MDNEVIHIIKFSDETLQILQSLTEAIQRNNELQDLGNPNEFIREVCANIYAGLLMNSLGLNANSNNNNID